MTKKTKKLSRRPLKRDVHFECELGPYFTSTVPLKNNKERPSQRYVLWCSSLPKRKRERWIAAVQQVNRPGNLGDYVHNPIVFQKIVVSPDEGTAKLAYRAAQKAMYFMLKDLLMQLTRPVLRFKTGDAEQWTNFEPGAATETLGAWRAQTLWDVAKTWLGVWEDPAL